jgi:hypothetical protein
MKRVLIAVASVGILAPAAWMMGANAQQMSPGPAPSQAYGRSQMAPTQAYAQRRVRRSARRAPAAAAPGAPAAAAPGGLTYTPGSGPPPYDVQRSAQAPYEWHAAPGPNRRGNMCVTHTDPLRGYGFQAPCPPAKKK